MEIETIETSYCGDIDETFTLVTDTQEVKEILNYIGCDDDYGLLFVEVLDGDYGTIWAAHGVVPYIWKLAYRVR